MQMILTLLCNKVLMIKSCDPTLIANTKPNVNYPAGQSVRRWEKWNGPLLAPPSLFTHILIACFATIHINRSSFLNIDVKKPQYRYCSKTLKPAFLSIEQHFKMRSILHFSLHCCPIKKAMAPGILSSPSIVVRKYFTK